MRRSGGGKQRVVLSEEARERQKIRDRAVVLQQTSPVVAHQFLTRNSKASSSLAVELLSNLLSRQLKNECVLYGCRIDTSRTEYESCSIHERPAMSSATKNVPERLAGVCSGIGR
jgi:hypothetical protein